jgi:hypothetical protein
VVNAGAAKPSTPKGAPTPKSHNNYLAQSAQSRRRAKSTGTGKVGAPFGNRNAANPGSAEFRAFKAKADDLIARMKAAIAAAEAIITQNKRSRRRIICITNVANGVVMRERAVVRIAAKRQRACRDEDGLSGNVLAGRQDRREPVASRAQPSYSGAGAGLAQLVEHLICNQGVTGSSPVAGTTGILAGCVGSKNWRK